jgi:ATP-dependent DNA ligase
MPNFAFPPAAARAEIPHPLHLQIVSPSVQAPDGESWLHEMKHDGHRLLAIVAGSELRLISRNGHDRTPLFRAPFDKLAAAGCRRSFSTARSRCPTSAASPILTC